MLTHYPLLEMLIMKCKERLQASATDGGQQQRLLSTTQHMLCSADL
jgi:hypothetical protein